MNHLMVDLETMGTAPGSAIVAIGAVVFDPVAGTLGERIHTPVSLASAMAVGLTCDPDTITWWLRQGDAARAALTGAGAPLVDALEQLTRLYRTQRCGAIWGHGGNFDEPLVVAAYRAAHLLPPWRFWDSRCTRTIYALAGVKPDRAAGTHHNALDDAVAQAEAVIRAYRKLGLAETAASASFEGSLDDVAGRLA